MSNKAPTAVSMVPLPTSILGETGTWIMPKAIGMAPLMAGLVASGSGQSANAIATTQTMAHAAVLIVAPGVMVGNLYEYVIVQLAHIAAGKPVVCLIDTDTDLGFEIGRAHV